MKEKNKPPCLPVPHVQQILLEEDTKEIPMYNVTPLRAALALSRQRGTMPVETKKKKKKKNGRKEIGK